MINSLHAKEVFSASFMELLSKKPMDRISITNIVNNCDLSRQTFYRHFKDKYDLINWTLKVLLDRLNNEMKMEQSTYHQTLVKLLCTIQSQSYFFAEAFKMDGQNALVDFFHQYSVINGIENYGSNACGAKSKDEINFAFRYSAYGTIYCIIDWVLAGMKQTPEQLAGLILDNMTPMIRLLHKQQWPLEP